MRDYFGKNADALKEKKLFLFDMDGTIYLGDRVFDGVVELLDKIEKKGGRYVFITNNPSKSVKDYVKKVRRMGIRADGENFFTSAQAAVMLLKERYEKRLVYAQGTRSFVKGLKRGGLNVTCRYDERAEAVLVGYDPELTGKKLRMTCEMLTKNDVGYFATNPDWVCPVDFGFVPDCGSMCREIELATGKKPVFIGKPEPTMIRTVMEKFGNTGAETVVIGDRLYTDIASGIRAGVDTVCVLSGEVKLDEIKKSVDIKPTFVLESVKELLSVV